MADADIPHWLKNIPMAPEYRPTETEFVDPIAFISRIEREAAAFGICKVIPPVPKPSKKFVLSNLNRSLSKSPELGDAAAATSSSMECAFFTTRQQELGSRRSRPALPKQVWQSGEAYTLDQFEAKSKAFARSQLGGFKEVTPLLVESLFWKAVTEKPIYTEYANDVPGSGFAVPEGNFRYFSRRRIRKRGFLRGRVNEEKCGFRLMDSTKDGQPQKGLESDSCGEGREGSSGWKLSNSRWNLQVVARSPGSLTRFMPDEVPGVTSPMVYIGMLFSWFAWHVEDHELHSMNFLHMGSSKTWYAVPGDHAATLEEIVRVQGYGGNVDRLAGFIMLGEKTTLLSPEILVASSVPVCRLVQHPGEFVVTFPRAYHVGFSHGFNCGEAANFATPQWLKVAKEAAIRRAAMNLLPMLSHQQLLYILTMSFVTRVPRNLISGARSSRLRDRRKEEREFLVRKAFLTDMINENNLLCILLAKETSSSPILWEPDMLHRTSSVSQSHSCTSLEIPGSDQNGFGDQHNDFNFKESSCMVGCYIEKPAPESTSFHEPSFGDSSRNDNFVTSDVEALEVVEDEGDLPVGLNVDSGSLACVACGILGYPFMAIIQPSQKASRAIFPINCEKLAKTDCLSSPSYFQNDACGPASGERCIKLAEQSSLGRNCEFSQTCNGSLKTAGCKISHSENNYPSLDYSSTSSLGNKRGVLDATATLPEGSNSFQSSSKTLHSNCLCPCDSVKESKGSRHKKTVKTVEYDPRNSTSATQCVTNKVPIDSLNGEVGETKWDMSNVLLRPRIFCLQHAIDVEELLCSKGGGHIQVICHSDYLKIKAYAANIAEEIGAELDLDFPLENASQEDLDLINLSIDDEEHQEDGKDWTSKLGINLRYCVKLRKYSESSDEQLPLALSSIFSSSLRVPVVSNLRWLCRKSRTPAKGVGIILKKPQISTVINRNAPAKKADTSPTKPIQVYQSRKKSPSDMTFRDYNRSEKDLSISEQDANLHRSGEIVPFSENGGNLFTVPISIVRCRGISLNSTYKPYGDLNIAESGGFHLPANPECASCNSSDSVLFEKNSETIVSVPVIYQYQQHCHNILDCNCSAMRSGIRSTGEFCIDYDSGRCKSSEFHGCQAFPESKASGLKRLTGAVVVDGSESRLLASVEQCCEHHLLLTTGEDKHVDSETAGQNMDASTNFALLSKDHNDVSRLLRDSEMVIEVPMADEVSIANSSVQSKGKLCNIILPEDEILKNEIQPLKDVCASANSKMKQRTCSAEATAFVPLIGSYSSQRSNGNIMVTDVTTPFVENCYPDVITTRDKRPSFPLNIKSYIRRRNKRKREIEQHTRTPECTETEKKVEVQKKKGESEVEARHGGFVRSPCEGLRPRKVKILADQLEFASLYRRIPRRKVIQKVDNAFGRRRNGSVRENFK